MTCRFAKLNRGFRLALTGGLSLILGLVFLLVPTHILQAAWSTATNLSNTWTNSNQPAIAITSDGTLHVVWEEEGYIYYVNRPPDGDWSAPTSVPGCPQNSDDLSLTVGNDDTLHLVWWSSDLAGLYGVLYASKPSGGTWSSPERIAPDSSEIEGADVAVDGSGAVHAVWSYPLSGVHYVWHASKPPGGTWSSPLNLSNNFSYSTDPSIAVDSASTVHVVWKGTSYGDYEILYACKPDGGSWTSPFNVSDDSAASYEPSLAVDGADALHLVWRDSTWSVLYKTRPGGGAWQATELVGSNMLGLYRAPVIAIEGDGKHVAWQAPRGEIFYAFKLGSGAWSEAENASNSMGSSAVPDLAVDGTGTLHLVWADDTPGSNEVLYSSGTPGPAPPPEPPSDLTATAVSSTTIALAWYDGPGQESDFYIERSPDGAGGWIEIAIVGTDVATYQDTSLTPETTYYYRVRAYRHSDDQYSSYSDVANAATWDDDTVGPIIGSPACASSVLSNEPVTVTVQVSDQTTGGHGVFSTALRHGYTAPYSQSVISGSGPGGNGDGLWTIVIPAQGDAHEEQTLRFSLEACDGDNSPACSANDSGGSYFAIAIADDDTDPPAFTNPVPMTATDDMAILFQADIADPSGIYDTFSSTASVYLEWDIDGELDNDVAGSLGMGPFSGDVYRADAAMGPFAAGAVIIWHVWAEDADNSRSGAWSPLYYLEVGDDDPTGPVIGMPSYVSSAPGNESITVTADISDLGAGAHGVFSATLSYGYAAPYNQHNVPGSGPGGNGDGRWTFVIPAQGDACEGQTLRFSLEACDGDNSPACSVNDNGGSHFAVAVTDDDVAPPLFTNNTPTMAADSESVSLQVEITDPSGVYDDDSSTASVYLEWDTDGELNDDVTGSLDMDLFSGDIYRADMAIGPFPAGVVVVWRVWAEDDDNSHSGAWSPVFMVDILDDDTRGPVIDVPSYVSPASSDEPLTVTVQVSDQATGGHGVLGSTLRYGYTAPYDQASLSGSGPGGNGDGTWTFVIPAQEDACEGQTLRFYLEACDSDNSPACCISDDGGSYFAVTIADDDATPPAFSNPTPFTVTEVDSIVLRVEITDPSGVYDTSSSTASVYLQWDTDGELENDVAGSVGMNLVGTIYQADTTIGPFTTGTIIVWRVWAEDDDNSRSGAWSPVYYLEVRDDDSIGPVIGMPSYASPASSNEAITITVDISDQATAAHGVSGATLRYGDAAPYNQFSISGSSPDGNGDGTWTFVIPAQGDIHEGQTLRFYLEACDGDNSPACSANDNSGSYFAATITDDDNSAPAFANNVPITATDSGTIFLQVDITDPSGVYDTSSSAASVYLEWDTDGELGNDVAGSLGMDVLSGDTYRADTAIGPCPAGVVVAWRVWAEDDDNSRSGAWSPIYTLDVQDDDAQGPAIGRPSYASSVPSNEPLTITVAVSDHIAGDHGVFSTTLRYGYTAPYDQRSLSGSDPGGNGDGVWTFVLPAQGDASEGQTLRFSLEACDGDNSPACSVNDDGSEYYGVQITTPSHWLYLPLVLNGFR